MVIESLFIGKKTKNISLLTGTNKWNSQLCPSLSYYLIPGWFRVHFMPHECVTPQPCVGLDVGYQNKRHEKQASKYREETRNNNTLPLPGCCIISQSKCAFILTLQLKCKSHRGSICIAAAPLQLPGRTAVPQLHYNYSLACMLHWQEKNSGYAEKLYILCLLNSFLASLWVIEEILLLYPCLSSSELNAFALLEFRWWQNKLCFCFRKPYSVWRLRAQSLLELQANLTTKAYVWSHVL